LDDEYESQSGEMSGRSGSDDEERDDSLSNRGSTDLRKKVEKDQMSVNLMRLDEVPAQIKAMI
jgi:hypothetical protein